MISSKAKNISMGGMALSLTVLILYLTNISPINRLTLLGFSSVPIIYVVLKSSACWGLTIYVASSILCFLLVPNKVIVILYSSFFGLFPLVKYWAERYRYFIQYLIKLLHYGVTFIIIYGIWRSSINIHINLYIVVFGGLVLFIIYDYVLSMIVEYLRKLRV